MRLSIMVLSDPSCTRAGSLALRLLSGAHDQGHQLDTAFFYHNGAYAAVNPGVAEQTHWQQLSQASGLRCVVCSTALARLHGAGAMVATPWRRGGLGDWLGARERSDRIVVLGSYR